MSKSDAAVMPQDTATDPEIAAMSAVYTALKPLTAEERERVLTYVESRCNSLGEGVATRRGRKAKAVEPADAEPGTELALGGA